MESPPKAIGRYVIHGALASGGMASVFYARLLGPSGFARTVVVKRPHPQLATEREFAMMFIDEARVASRIHHPNVVSTLDVIETPSELALVMDYVHGEALSKLSAAARRQGERIPLPIAAAIMIDVLHGLHAAHEATDEQGRPLEIVHRDVSPQNVLVGADGITRLVDFGIAKAAGRLLTTRHGAIKGKYAYMAPEQIRGERVTRRTDLYAASIVFWELLTGRGLFRGANEAEEIYKTLEASITAPSRVAPDVPRAFDEIVLRGLEQDPEKRYPTARAMAVDLERAAPAVRPSEVAVWVRALAGEVLAERAAVIAEMEGSAPHLLPQLAARKAFALPNLAGPSAAAPGSRAGELQSSHAGVVSERSGAPPARGRIPRRLAFVTLAVLLASGAYGARSLLRGSARGAAGEAPPPLASSAPVVVSLPAPVTSVPSAGVEAEPPIASSSASAKPHRARPPSHKERPAAPEPCDPPCLR